MSASFHAVGAHLPPTARRGNQRRHAQQPEGVTTSAPATIDRGDWRDRGWNCGSSQRQGHLATDPVVQYEHDGAAGSGGCVRSESEINAARSPRRQHSPGLAFGGDDLEILRMFAAKLRHRLDAQADRPVIDQMPATRC